MHDNCATGGNTTRTGLFITFEGPEGAGKTTQISLLESKLLARGWAVTRTREPGGDVVGERVRDLLLSTPMSAQAELFLLAAARAQNVLTVVKPAVEAGNIVLCDRFTDSTLAYQGFGRGLSLEVLARINLVATGGIVPTRTLLLDLPPAEGLARQEAEKQNRLDRESIDFHERVRDGFLQIAMREPARFVVIDAARSFAAVAADVQAAVFPLLS